VDLGWWTDQAMRDSSITITTSATDTESAECGVDAQVPPPKPAARMANQDHSKPQQFYADRDDEKDGQGEQDEDAICDNGKSDQNQAESLQEAARLARKAVQNAIDAAEMAAQGAQEAARVSAADGRYLERDGEGLLREEPALASYDPNHVNNAHHWWCQNCPNLLFHAKDGGSDHNGDDKSDRESVTGKLARRWIQNLEQTDEQERDCWLDQRRLFELAGERSPSNLARDQASCEPRHRNDTERAPKWYAGVDQNVRPEEITGEDKENQGSKMESQIGSGRRGQSSPPRESFKVSVRLREFFRVSGRSLASMHSKIHGNKTRNEQ